MVNFLKEQEYKNPFNPPEALHMKMHRPEPCILPQKTKTKDFPKLGPKLKSHICEYCSRAFSARHGLQQHHKRHPNGSCTLNTHTCDICDRAFYQRNHLMLHKRQHLNASNTQDEGSKDNSSSEEKYNITPDIHHVTDISNSKSNNSRENFTNFNWFKSKK